MADRPSGVTGWMRSLFGGGKGAPPAWTGEEGLGTGRRAVIFAEALTAETLCRPSTIPGPADQAAVNAFGAPVGVTLGSGARGVVAAAAGLSLAGRRVTASVPADDLPEVQDQLRAAAERRLPLILRAEIESVTGNGRGHGNYHVLADTGAFLTMARDVQQALDLTLVARRVAETALTPGVVAVDASETAWTVQDVRLPDVGMVREFVGDPAAEISSPTPAQTLVFGETRRRVPRWFDLDRPAALGVPLSGPDFDAAAAGRRTFFAGHLLPLVEQAMQQLGEKTGRRLSLVSRHRLEDANHVIVAQGAAVETAEAVADHLRATEKAKIGVLGLNWLRPFPEQQIREALRGVQVVTVLDRGTDPSAGTPPLMRELLAVLRDKGPRMISATFARLRASELVAVCRNMQAGEQALPELRLGIGAPADSSYPRRQAFLQRVRRDYPELESICLPAAAEAPDPRPEGSKTVALHVQSETVPEDALESLGRALREDEALGVHVRGSSTLVEPGLWHARVTCSPSELREPGDEVPADLTLIGEIELSLEINPLEEAAAGGSVVIATDLDPQNLWDLMRPAWRDAIRRRELELYRVGGGIEQLIAVAAPLLRGESGDLERIRWTEFPDVPATEADQELPLVVRRYEGTGSTYDNVSRFWGEFAQPRLSGEGDRPVPDPYLALGAVPAGTATFHDMTAQREVVPRIDAARCTGCGKCWSSCPDSAIGALAAGTEALFSVAMDRAESASDQPPTAAAGKVRRAYKQLAAKLDGMLVKSEPGVLDEDAAREAFAWLMAQMKPGEGELTEMSRAFEATLAELMTLPLSVTEPFFKDAHRERKGSAELLLLAVNPQACQGCGVCAAVCPDEAIVTEPQSPQLVREMREAWTRWERLPDTPGPSIARAAKHPRIGPLPAVLMSRHCLYTVAGGDGAEPGSGERLATRQVAAVVEYEMQRRLLDQVGSLQTLADKLRDGIQVAVAKAFPVTDLAQLDAALMQTTGKAAGLGDLLGKLEEFGERSDVDTGRIRRMIRVARDVDRARWRVAEGMQGTGRARYGLVVAGRSAAEWAARFPRNPFGVPLTVDLEGGGADLAVGILEGLVAERVAETRLARLGELLLEAPSDLPARERVLRSLTWRDLEPEELALCPPILVLGGTDGLTGEALPGLSRLLTSGLPIKVVLLDDCDLADRGVDPALLALAHREAFVLSASVAHPEHLFEGVSAALRYSGPALIRVHAPSPARHGFAPEATVERARLAVGCRVHPLLRYDPSAAGSFGLRMSLEGNPEVEESWVRDADGTLLTPAHWAAWETRFARHYDDAPETGVEPLDKVLEFSSDVRGSTIPTVPGPNGRSLAVGETLLAALDERAANWATLLELAGAVTPFTAAVRERVENELREVHEAELAELKREHEGRLAEQQRSQGETQAARLRDRLLQLAGYGEARAESPDGEGTAS